LSIEQILWDPRSELAAGLMKRREIIDWRSAELEQSRWTGVSVPDLPGMLGAFRLEFKTSPPATAVFPIRTPCDGKSMVKMSLICCEERLIVEGFFFV